MYKKIITCMTNRLIMNKSLNVCTFVYFYVFMNIYTIKSFGLKF